MMVRDITEYEDILLSSGGAGACANDGDEFLHMGSSLACIRVVGCICNHFHCS